MKFVLIVDTVQLYRDVFRSQLLPKLLENPAHSAIIYTSFKTEAILKEFRHQRLKLYPLRRIKPTPLASLLFSLTKDLWTVEKPESSYTQKRKIEARANRNWALKLRLSLARTLKWLGVTSPQLIRLGERLGHDEDFARLLSEEKPDAVVFSNMIPSDLECLKEARRQGLPLVLAVASWDNPTSKGPLTVVPDFVFAWSPEMKKEMETCHEIPATRIAVIGVIYFENYFFPERLMSRTEFCSRLGVPPETKIIQFATGDSAIIKCNQPFVRILQKMVAENSFGIPCHLLVRVSPKDIFPLYKEFENLPFTTVQYPLGEGSAYGRHSWVPLADEDYDRASTLRNTDVLLTSSSSIILDACCFDLPVVNLAYDAGLNVKPWESVVRFYKYIHVRPVAEEDATWMVKRDDELREAVKGCLFHPENRRQQRRRLVERVVGYTDGQSCDRWVKALTEFVEQNQRSTA